MRELAGFVEHQLDQKSRMRIPPKFRELLGDDEVAIIASPHGCLEIYSATKFKEKTELFKKVPESDREAYKIVREIARSTFYPTEDNQGRFVLPAPLKKFAKINKNITFVGMFDKVEIWAAERLEEEQGGELNPVTLSDGFELLAKYGM
ncbi:MAG: division/cell wall cluster transcriptional repressor MraZ [Christensenellales bacterium]|jgi:MraZ protein|nr:hypothetical protein [Eubacteriales bacterium]